MATSQHIEFGYNPPSGERGRETIHPREYMSDLQSALDVATQGFKSIWVADHLNYSTEWRLGVLDFAHLDRGALPGGRPKHAGDEQHVSAPVGSCEDGRHAARTERWQVRAWVRSGLARGGAQPRSDSNCLDPANESTAWKRRSR